MPTAADDPETLRDETRFDDRVATVAAGMAGDDAARVAAWRQMIDLLSQPSASWADSGGAIAAVTALHPSIPLPIRIEAARVAAFGAPPPALVLLLANDHPAVASALLGGVRLVADEWAKIMPRLSPVARGILRARRDLDGDTQAQLASFGPVDFILSGSVEVPPGAVAESISHAGPTRISDLVARIEAFRQTRPAPDRASSPAPEPLAAFRFETDAGGVICWVDASDRAALIGIALHQLADGAGPGVDAAVLGALRHRGAFRDARLSVASDLPAGGDWRISAVPGFDDASGRFTGYRGVARRARPDQRADTRPATGALASDSLRQLVHELRTPLNAITGFAELIEHQVMGPVAAPYRAAAADVRETAGTLIGAIDDLDLATRIDAGTARGTPAAVDLDALVVDALAAHGAFLAERGVAIATDIDAARVRAHVDADGAGRLLARFFGAFLPLAVAGETLVVDVTVQERWCRVMLDRPRAINQMDGAALRAMAERGGEDATTDPALLLGLDFAIRLLDGLARQLGGGLSLDTPRLTLSLPGAAMRAREDLNRM